MRRIMLLLLIVFLAVPAFAQPDPPRLDIIDLVKNMDWINIVLVAVFSIGGIVTRIAVIGRSKLKQLGEACIVLYEYTDDKVLDKKERADMIRRVSVLLGKKKSKTATVNATAKIREIKASTRHKRKTGK